MSLTFEQEQAYYQRMVREGRLYRNLYYQEPIKVETKQERIKRVAKEKMLASFNLYNKKTLNIIEVIQICKPKHKLYNYR